MDHVSPEDDSLVRADWRLASQALAGFWALHLACRTMIAAVQGNLAQLLDPSLWASLSFAFMLSVGLCLLLRTVRRRGLRFGLALTALVSAPVSVIYAATEFAFYYHLSPDMRGGTEIRPDGTVVTQDRSGNVTYRQPGNGAVSHVRLAPLQERVLAAGPANVATNSTGWYFFYFGLGALYVGLSSAVRLRQAERRAAAYERLAHASQLRALRYQVNPHFLFNTLNSLSALILMRRIESAEEMILNLSAFFRSTLDIDPTAEISLREEIRLQQLYLDIESARFPDRLRIDLAIPDELWHVQVPALLLQPLVENAVKYGVAASPTPVTVRIAAYRCDERMVLTVENEAPEAREADRPAGTGVGLGNVRERLAARFGDEATSAAARHDDGIFRVRLDLPMVLT